MSLNSTSLTGLVENVVHAEFTLNSPLFSPGDDKFISSSTVTNLDTGDSLTFVLSSGFTFSGGTTAGNQIALDPGYTLTLNGKPAGFGPFILDGVTFKIYTYGIGSSTGITNGSGDTLIDYQITPEPSSCLMCVIAGGTMLIASRQRRRRGPAQVIAST